MSIAFEMRLEEDHLSVNWVEYFETTDIAAAIDKIREAFRSKGCRLRASGRFVILGIEEINLIGIEKARCSLHVKHLPLEDDRSHAGIFGYTADDLEVAAEIRALVGQSDVCPAVK